MSYQTALRDEKHRNYTEPVGVTELGTSNRFYQRATTWICLAAVGAFIVIIALSIAVANKKACDPLPVPPNAGFVAENGCRYSSVDVVSVQSLAGEFYRCALVHNTGFSGNFLFGTLGDLKTLSGCYWDLSSPDTPDFQKLVTLQNKLDLVLDNPAVRTTEKLRVKFIEAELTLVRTLVEKGHFFAATGASAVDYAWWSDVVIDASMTANLLATVDHRNQDNYDDTVLGWLQVYAEYLPRWRAQMERAVAEKKTHASIVMEYQQIYYLQALDSNFTAVCPTLLNTTSNDQCFTIVNNITAQHKSFRDYFVDSYIPACALTRPNSAPGLWNTPDGKEVYQAWLQFHLGMNESAREIFDLGVERVAANRNDTLSIIQLIDPSIETFEEAVAALSNSSDTRWYICNNDSAEVIAYVQALQERIEDNLLDEFGYFAGVRPRVRVEGSPSTYANTATYDHVRNFWTAKPIYNVGRHEWCYPNGANGSKTYYYDRLQLATVMHEAMPGHGMQLQLEAEVDCGVGSPYATGPTAYYEGWGLYAETLGYYLSYDPITNPKGLYANPFDELSFYTGTMLRNNRLQVDTGLHGNLEGLPNWSWDEAWQETVENGFTEFSAKAEVERYIQMPGQATAYMIGNLKLLQARQSLEEVLGMKFHAAEFHNIILRWGGSTFDDLCSLLTTYEADKLNPGSATGMFGYDLIKEQFSSTKPVVGLGRVSAGVQQKSPSFTMHTTLNRIGGTPSAVVSRAHTLP